MTLFTENIANAWPNILIAWAALATAAISPGATASAIMGISMGQGRGAGFRFTAGAMTGSTIWALSAGLGLSAWLTGFAQGIYILKIVGGLYLFWLAYKALRSAMRSDEKPVHAISGKALYWRGLALHITNPKAILGWVAVMTLSQTGATAATGGLDVLVVTLLGCLAITFTIHFTYAAVFASAPARASYRRARRWIEGTLAAVFGLAGTRLLTSP